jgi:peroxiredoxin
VPLGLRRFCPVNQLTDITELSLNFFYKLTLAMKKLSIMILIIGIMAAVSCKKEKGYVITGELTGFPDSTMLYLLNLNTQDDFDSSRIINNKFVFRGQLQNVPEQIRLHTTVNKQSVYTNLLIGNENIRIDGDIKDFPRDLRISGSKVQEEYTYYLNLNKTLVVKRDSIVRDFLKLSPEVQEKKGKEIWDKIRVIDDSIHSIDISYVKSHLNTFSGVIELGYLLRSFDKDSLKAMYERLSPEIKASRYAKIIDINLREKISEVGDMYHDFEAINRDEEKVKFSELTGKYILLDFTSAGCGPCIQSAEELRQIEKTFNDSLAVVSFSGDAKKDIWLNSLKRDSVTWISLWDGEGSSSETWIKYGVQGIPAFFLIDPSGKIIDKWTGYGKGLLIDKLKRLQNI